MVDKPFVTYWTIPGFETEFTHAFETLGEAMGWLDLLYQHNISDSGSLMIISEDHLSLVMGSELHKEEA